MCNFVVDMKATVIHTMVLLCTMLCTAGTSWCREDAVIVAFWNLENFFDFTDTGYSSSDTDFSPEGERHWTKSRFWKKCHGVAKTVLWMSDRYGRMPDVMGVAEVENRGVLQAVLNGTLLKKHDYVQVHEDSPDTRGIDVALIYRKSVWKCLEARTVRISSDMDGKPLRTRDILYVCLEDREGETYHFLVNHHPSKYGGAKESETKRAAVMNAMVSVCDSLVNAGEGNIISMGDFNDTPDGEAFSLTGKSLVNMSLPLSGKGRGTIRYAGKWELIDMFLTSGDIADVSVMDICFPDFLGTTDRAHSGLKPLRTYTGPRYTGGISDHLPIVLSVSRH